jgi:hypothetical protein
MNASSAKDCFKDKCLKKLKFLIQVHMYLDVNLTGSLSSFYKAIINRTFSSPTNVKVSLFEFRF